MINIFITYIIYIDPHLQHVILAGGVTFQIEMEKLDLNPVNKSRNWMKRVKEVDKLKLFQSNLQNLLQAWGRIMMKTYLERKLLAFDLSHLSSGGSLMTHSQLRLWL